MRSPELNLRRPWPEVKEMIKENDYRLTDEDLDYSPGRESELIENLSRKLGKTQEEVRIYIESISANRGKAS